MSSIVEARGLRIGEGRPKLAVPVVADSVDAVRIAVRALPLDAVDLVELRADHLRRLDATTAAAAVRAARDGLPDRIPLLFTVRSAAEGGARAIPRETALAASLAALATGVDLLDVEQAAPDRDALIAAARGAGCPVVLSWHDFAATPPVEDLLERLVQQEAAGADLVKVAVTPASAADVLALLDATARYAERPSARPAITMSMGRLGVVTRIAGSVFGSAVTFGAVGEASAPGQLDAIGLRRMLDVLG